MDALKIAHVAPVATTVPPPKSGSVETMTSLLTEGLVARGHDVTLFATARSKTSARLHATFEAERREKLLGVGGTATECAQFGIVHEREHQVADGRR